MLHHPLRFRLTRYVVRPDGAHLVVTHIEKRSRDPIEQRARLGQCGADKIGSSELIQGKLARPQIRSENRHHLAWSDGSVEETGTADDGMIRDARLVRNRCNIRQHREVVGDAVGHH